MDDMFMEYCRRAYGFLGRKRTNPGRELALMGARQRKKAYEAKRRAIVDDMRQRHGLPEYAWRD